MLALGILPSMIIAVALLMIPESPRWLVLQNRVEDARLILIGTIGDVAEMENRLAEIIQQASSNVNTVKSEEKPIWRDLLRLNPAVHKMLIVGVGIHCFQQLTGMEALVYYSPTIFKTAGIGDNSQLLAATVFVGAAKTSFLIIALFLIDRVGRKPLLYISTIGMTVCLLGLAVSLALMEGASVGISLAILFVCGDAAFFSLGMGPVSWVLSSEIYPLRLRAQAVALGIVGYRLCSGLISLSFLSVSSAISMPGVFFVFSALSAMSVAFVHNFVPETKGKTLEHIECLFQGKRALKEGHLELVETERLVLKEDMGMLNGNADMLSNIDLGYKSNYRRMNSETGECNDDSMSHDYQNSKANSCRKCVMANAFFASLNSVLLGYDGGVLSGAIIFIHEDLKIIEVQEVVLVGCLSVISLIGSLAGGRSSDAIGGKWTMGIGAIVFQIGGLLMTIAPSFQMLMVGRLLSGIGVGLGGTIMGVYIAEISPAASRGFLTTFPEIFINIGILLGYISNYAFAGLPMNINWRVMLGRGILPSVIIGFAIFIIPESPRWLVLQNRVEEARSILLRTIGHEKEAEERLAEIQKAAESAGSEKSEEKAVWHELLRPEPAVAKMLIAGIGIQCFQQITGIDALVYYSPAIFKGAGIEDNSQLLAANVAVGVTKTAFILIALFLIDKIGRKPLLYISTIGMTICLFCVVLALAFVGKGPFGISLALLSVCGNVAFFSVGMGPINWVLTSEIFPLRLRAQAVASGFMGNRLCSGIISLSFLSLSSTISVPGTFLLFTALSALSVAFVYKLVPETKGKTLEQIESLFQGGEGLNGGQIELADTKRLIA
ncbi:hypothetical protein Cgig2_009662 [Carnegiea gigantea]|uniref:Major facilitator superfamily (MFS) profile domain-containing protein n=1 Tax=Carnegiea gigantea TaxID=171969 RepID=A0A9Q1JEM6_9CARY|nr:hypothetical protein Cgig2_009662 [Carnegiea gigantea]